MSAFQLKAQPSGCIFKKPAVTINFGTGDVREVNTEMPFHYDRVTSSCPTDGHYTYTPFTSDCFRGDWLTLSEDHTDGDVDGNMMLVNASRSSGTFLTTTIKGLKSSTVYEFQVWMMNVCKPSDKCPFPLLPNISIRLQTPDGKMVAQFGTGDLVRREAPHWTPYRALFTTPSSETALTLIMANNAPGGCGNDFALDDISFRECEKPKPVLTTSRKPPVEVKLPPKPPAIAKVQAKTPAPVNPRVKAPTLSIKKETPEKRELAIIENRKPQTDSLPRTSPVLKQKPQVFARPPGVLLTRANPVIKQIETEAAEIKLDLYDNGYVDGDTVSIYHNNKLLISHARLSHKPISFRVTVNPDQPHHELVMVAENLGSISPNTSLMILTAGPKRYEIFISSTEEKNAKIVIDLKQ